VVVAPGRGTYNRAELGYLGRHGGSPGSRALIRALDGHRAARGAPGVAELDAAARFQPALHGPGANSAGLIYACALTDFLAIDQERVEIVAVTGNSMGFYLALAAAKATDPLGSGIELVERMACLMDEMGTGGQLVYPLQGDDWTPSPEREAAVRAALDDGGGALFVSIRLGGSVVLAGTDEALARAAAMLPAAADRFPLRLARHAAFHTPLLEPVSARALGELPVSIFSSPVVPLIDGRGEIWQPGVSPDSLRAYTLTTQVTATYDFSLAVEVAVKEFAPDRLIVLGPGTGMGAPVLQTLARLRWLGLSDRAAWLARQAKDPFVIGMGVEDQRRLVTR
jgi:acyl transferase domain-containing protein